MERYVERCDHIEVLVARREFLNRIASSVYFYIDLSVLLKRSYGELIMFGPIRKKIGRYYFGNQLEAFDQIRED